MSRRIRLLGVGLFAAVVAATATVTPAVFAGLALVPVD